jgi:hypothetical protein
MAMGLFKLLFGSQESVRSAEPLVRLHLASAAKFNCEIVGEASYQQTLDALCGGKCEDGHDFTATAQLCFQDDNPYDANAVVVLINRKIVGYIPRSLAPLFRSEILRINPKELPVTCDAKIVGGWDRGDGDEGYYGVKLSIAEPFRPEVSGEFSAA